MATYQGMSYKHVELLNEEWLIENGMCRKCGTLLDTETWECPICEGKDDNDY